MPFPVSALVLWPQYQRFNLRTVTLAPPRQSYMLPFGESRKCCDVMPQKGPLGKWTCTVQSSMQKRQVKNARLANASCTAQWQNWPTPLSFDSRRTTKGNYFSCKPTMPNAQLLCVDKLLFLLPSPALCTHTITCTQEKEKRKTGEGVDVVSTTCTNHVTGHNHNATTPATNAD